MTSNSIAAFRATEEQRHNLVSEAQQQRSIEENIRHNKSYEAIIQQGNYLNYKSSIYGSNLAYRASLYSADKHYAAARYSADRNYAAVKYSADRNAQTSMFNSKLQAMTQKQIARLNSRTNIQTAQMSGNVQRYGTATNAQIQRENMRNQSRMNFASNTTQLITSAMSGMSNATSSFARLIPLFVGL